MAEHLTLSLVLPVSPERLFDAWMDTAEHSTFTGSPASVEAWVGGRHMAFGSYAWGENVALERPTRIVQTWRTTDFPDGAEPSQLEVRFRAVDGGTELTLVHTELPDGSSAGYEQGWREFYFTPMTAYFSAPARRPARARGAAGGAKKAAPARKKAKTTKKATQKKPATKKAAKKKAAKKKPVARARKAAASRPANTKKKAPKARKKAAGTRKR